MTVTVTVTITVTVTVTVTMTATMIKALTFGSRFDYHAYFRLCLQVKLGSTALSAGQRDDDRKIAV